MTHFMAPEKSLGDLDAEAVAALIASTGDVALVLDVHGVVQDIAYGNEALAREWGSRWVGRPWVESVTSESRPKIAELLADAQSDGPLRWRHVNHPAVAEGGDVAVQYVALQVGQAGRIVAIGRDLRGISALQQRLVAAQHAIERDYSRLRQMELRYRLLFQASPEAVLIVDAANLKVSEANPSAGTLLGTAQTDLPGKSLLDAFDEPGAAAVQTILSSVRATGRNAEITAMGRNGTSFTVYVALFRQDGAALFLVRLADQSTARTTPAPAKSNSAALLEYLPDAVVVTDKDGRVLEANPAFLDLAQLGTAEQARGELLDRWLGRPGVDLSVLVANLRQHGSVRLYATTLRGEYGAVVEVELSAVTLPGAEEARIGMVLRNVGRRLTAVDSPKAELPRSVEQLKELVGRVPMKDLVRQTTDVVEQLCIEAALELTGNNRASAAEILGLSRQSLYVKLRRFGMTEGEAEPEGLE